MRTRHLAHAGARGPGRLPPGEWTYLSDDLTEGMLLKDLALHQRLRSAHRGELIQDLQRVKEAVSELQLQDELVIWHGPAPTDQMLLPWLATLLRAAGVPRGRVRLASPLGGRGEVVRMQAAGPRELMRGYLERRPLDAGLELLLLRLWEALTAETPDLLVQLSEAELAPLPTFRATREGILARYPDATGLGFHDRVLLFQCSPRWRPVARVLEDTVREAAPTAPLSPRNAWLRLLRLLGPGHSHGLLALRTEGSLNPAECEVRLTPLGLEALEGTLDILPHLPLCEWIGGVLLLSPHQLWRRTKTGLHRQCGNQEDDGRE